MNVLRSRANAFCKAYDAAPVAEYVHEHCHENAEEVIRQANLIKADDPFPFPALTQIEVYGTDSK